MKTDNYFYRLFLFPIAFFLSANVLGQIKQPNSPKPRKKVTTATSTKKDSQKDTDFKKEMIEVEWLWLGEEVIILKTSGQEIPLSPNVKTEGTVPKGEAFNVRVETPKDSYSANEFGYVVEKSRIEVWLETKEINSYRKSTEVKFKQYKESETKLIDEARITFQNDYARAMDYYNVGKWQLAKQEFEKARITGRKAQVPLDETANMILSCNENMKREEEERRCPNAISDYSSYLKQGQFSEAFKAVDKLIEHDCVPWKDIWIKRKEIARAVERSLITKSGSFKDPRDSKSYRTLKFINGQEWMSENLNYNSTKIDYCYEKKSENCQTYGRLYSFRTALKACPEGWHLPSKSEFEALLNMYTKAINQTNSKNYSWYNLGFIMQKNIRGRSVYDEYGSKEDLAFSENGFDLVPGGSGAGTEKWGWRFSFPNSSLWSSSSTTYKTYNLTYSTTNGPRVEINEATFRDYRSNKETVLNYCRCIKD